ncbi:MAG: HNH endonuclease [Planctomycetota bacterium]
MPFDPEIRTKALLWSDRHCCLCKKACGINIEVHHIVPENSNGTNDRGNAIPLCYECHGLVQHYNNNHPLGTKYKPDELIKRREQVYEEYTRHLVPPIYYEMKQALPEGKFRQFPNVGFSIGHLGESLPVKVRVLVRSSKSGESLGLEPGYYTGDKLWNINPKFSISGHFEIPKSYKVAGESFTLAIQVGIIDEYDREHKHLPVGYSYNPGRNEWILEPSISET